jgi:hypothetical protein
MDVSGEIDIFEGQRACAPLQRRILGWWRHAQWIWLTAIIFVGLLSQLLVDALFEDGGIFAFLLVMVVGLVLMIRNVRSLAPKAWMRRGVSGSSPVLYGIEDTVLRIVSPHSETRMTWTGISEIMTGRDSWLFIGQGMAYFLPRRFFADQAAEAAFLSACLAHMTPEARALSMDATRFIDRT